MTDDAGWQTVLLGVQQCAATWEDEARIIGNVRAGDIKRAVHDALAENARLDADCARLNQLAAENCAWASDAQAENARLRAEMEYRANRVCPFPSADLEPSEPCPVCGDLGTFTAENMDKQSNCVARPLSFRSER